MYAYYNNLPDSLSIDEMQKHFQDLLAAFEQHKISRDDFLKSMGQLANRQWHTYTILCHIFFLVVFDSTPRALLTGVPHPTGVGTRR